MRGKARRQKSEEEIRESQRTEALTHLQKGEISKAVSRLTSFGVASMDDPTVMAALRSIYVARGKELPESVIMGQPIDSLGGLKETLLKLPTGVSPGTGGLRGEYLTCLAEVWEDHTMLEQFGLMYLCGQLPAWWYRVWGSVTTVPLFKTVERETVRPVGMRNPQIRTLHSQVIWDNRAAFTAFLEPQQLAPSEAGGQKLVNQVRMLMEEHMDWVMANVDVRNAHNEVVEVSYSDITGSRANTTAFDLVCRCCARSTHRLGDRRGAGGGGDPGRSKGIGVLCHCNPAGCQEF